jgi:hypothetical protein
VIRVSAEGDAGKAAYLDELQTQALDTVDDSIEGGLVRDQPAQQGVLGLEHSGHILEVDKERRSDMTSKPEDILDGHHASTFGLVTEDT